MPDLSIPGGNVTTTGIQTLTGKTVPDSNTFTHDLTAVPNQSGGWSEYFVSGSDYPTTTTNLETVTGMTTGTLTASARYEFEVNAQITWTADTNGTKAGFHGGGTGTAVALNAIVIATNAATTAAAITATTIDTATAAFCAFNSTNVGTVTAKGFFVANSTGTPTFSFQVQHPVSGATTVKVGSVMRVRLAHT